MQHNPTKLAYKFLSEDGNVELTHGELNAQVRSIAATLDQAGMRGERALLVYPPGLEFITAFLGCLKSGVTAVPAYPPGSRRTLPRLAAIVRDARPAVALTASSHVERYRSLTSSLPEFTDMIWLATDGPEVAPEFADLFQGQPPADDDIAFLQYTSGSTSTPKGVRVTHGNLAANEAMIQRAFETEEESVILGWLPLFHDMGLIGNVLQPLYVGDRKSVV